MEATFVIGSSFTILSTLRARETDSTGLNDLIYYLPVSFMLWPWPDLSSCDQRNKCRSAAAYYSQHQTLSMPGQQSLAGKVKVNTPDSGDLNAALILPQVNEKAMNQRPIIG
jgi:hypothetical protein